MQDRGAAFGVCDDVVVRAQRVFTIFDRADTEADGPHAAGLDEPLYSERTGAATLCFTNGVARADVGKASEHVEVMIINAQRDEFDAVASQ